MRVYGHTATGTPITEAMVDQISAEAESGYKGWVLKPGRPSVQDHRGPTPTRTLRIPAELDAALQARAALNGQTVSQTMREAIQAYLNAA